MRAKRTIESPHRLQKLIPEKEQLIREGKFEEALILKKKEEKIANKNSLGKRKYLKINKVVRHF